MNAPQFLESLQSRGVQLIPDSSAPSGVRATAPRGVVTAKVAARIREALPALLPLIADGTPGPAAQAQVLQKSNAGKRSDGKDTEKIRTPDSESSCLASNPKIPIPAPTRPNPGQNPSSGQSDPEIPQNSAGLGKGDSSELAEVGRKIQRGGDELGEADRTRPELEQVGTESPHAIRHYPALSGTFQSLENPSKFHTFSGPGRDSWLQLARAGVPVPPLAEWEAWPQARRSALAGVRVGLGFNYAASHTEEIAPEDLELLEIAALIECGLLQLEKRNPMERTQPHGAEPLKLAGASISDPAAWLRAAAGRVAQLGTAHRFWLGSEEREAPGRVDRICEDLAVETQEIERMVFALHEQGAALSPA